MEKTNRSIKRSPDKRIRDIEKGLAGIDLFLEDGRVAAARVLVDILRSDDENYVIYLYEAGVIGQDLNKCVIKVSELESLDLASCIPEV